MANDVDRTVSPRLHQQLMQVAMPLHHNGVQTQNDENKISATVSQIMAAITLTHPGLTADQLAHIRSMLDTMSTKHNHADMLQVAEDAARNFVLSNDQQSENLTSEQQVKVLWIDFEKRNKENEDEFEKLCRMDIIDHEQLDYIYRERERLDQLPRDSDERLKGEWEFIKYQEAVGLKAAEAAKGNATAEHASTKILGNIAVQKAELDAIHAFNINAHENTPINKSMAGHIRLDESADIIEAGPIKMEVLDVTYYDVKAPTGAKERPSQGLEIKK